MNEKAPEVAERSSKRKCLRMGRSSKKVARRPGAEMMWPSGGGSRTCNPGSNLGTVAVALGPTMARSVKARTACVRWVCNRKEICCLPAGVQGSTVPGVRSWPLTCTTNRLSRETLSTQRVPETSDFSRSHTRIGITTILHNAPQLHYSLHPTHTIRSSPSRGPWARQPLPKSSSSSPCSKVPERDLQEITSHQNPFLEDPKT